MPFELITEEEAERDANPDEELFDTRHMRRRQRSRAGNDKLVIDVEVFLAEVGRRFTASMSEFYPKVNGRYPWGYVWASTLPCPECGRRFPMVGELRLRFPKETKTFKDPGQSFRIETDDRNGEFRIVVHEGAPQGTPTRVLAGKSKYASSGKIAICPFCGHSHQKSVHTRLSMQGERRDALLVAADIDDDGRKIFRVPTEEEVAAASRAAEALAKEEPFGFLPARPDERIPEGNTWTIQSVNYGDETYGDLCEARQTLGLVRLARAINEASSECHQAGLSPDYVKALAGYATAAMMRKIRRSTRGCRLEVPAQKVGDLFVNQSAVTVSYDWFESGLSEGPGSWTSLAAKTVTALRNLKARSVATPAQIRRGTAVALPYEAETLDAVVTDPPYDDMIDYSDSSDLFYVWAKRAMMTVDFELSATMHLNGVQEKDDEIIIKRGGSQANDHRDKGHFASMIRRAYAEMGRVVARDGVVTIVFGHGDPEVWHRMLSSLSQANLMLTGSWPAKTEAGGGGAGSANIVTTLTMACRPAPPNRPDGHKAVVESQIKAEIKHRMDLWIRSDLAITDMLMASAGPAMEVAGRYGKIREKLGKEVELDRFLVTARRAVREASAVPVDTLKLEDFDPRTLFALWWVRLYRRDLTAKSELRWELMAADLPQHEVKNLIHQEAKGCRFALSSQSNPIINAESAIIDVALAMAAAWPDGIDEVGKVLAAAGKTEPDEQLWAAITFLEGMLPHPDPDFAAWQGLTRNRTYIQQAAVEQFALGNLARTRRNRSRASEQDDSQESLF